MHANWHTLQAGHLIRPPGIHLHPVAAPPVGSRLWKGSRTRYLPASTAIPLPAGKPRGSMSKSTDEALLQAPRILTEIPGPGSRQLTAAESRHLAPGVQSLATLSGI